MKLFLLCVILSSSFAAANTTLLLIGGGKRPPESMRLFVEATGKKGPILVIPWASETTESGQNIVKEFNAFGATNAVIIPHIVLDTDSLHSQIKNARGIFFTGGDQNKLMDAIKKYETVEMFRERFKEGVVFGGTSAGTAIMSDPMLTGKETILGKGLGLLPLGYVVDQHFVVRQRWQRLAQIVSTNSLVGIGIDEDTSLFIRNNLAMVIGPTEVQVLKKVEGGIITSSYLENETFEIFRLQ